MTESPTSDRTAVVSHEALAGESSAAAPVATGRVGRYRLLRPLGSGGMGDVFEAHDPDLDRKVAVKVLRAHRRRNADADARLLREARVMARLSHPHLVPVYDVGRDGDRLFVAMELVDGETLDVWLRAAPRSPRRIVSVFVAAAEGLLAAHEAGLVHRDFKPGNVMVGPPGAPRPRTVRVLDFGLARTAGETTSERLAAGSADEEDGPEDTRLTGHGMIVGTPIYMAPEQHEGGEVDARSDQFAFCVALYAALFGERPYEGSMEELARAKSVGPPAPHDFRGVPPRLWPILQRGLAPHPSARYPSLRELIHDLKRRPRARRTLAASAAVATAAGLAWVLIPTARAPAECSNVGARLGEVWNESRRRATDDAVREADLDYADALARRATERLDRYAQAWVDAATAACLAESEDETAELVQRRRACLDRRRGDLGNAARLLERVNAETARAAVRVLDRLPDPAACNDPTQLLALLPLPDDAKRQAEVEELREAISEAEVLADAGRHEEALVAYDAVSDRVRTTAFEPLFAELDFARANSLRLLGRHEQSAAAFERAYDAAFGSGHDAVATQAAAMLVQQLAKIGNDPPEVERWIRNAEASLARVADDPRLRATVAFAKAVAADARGDSDAFLEHARAALELRTRALGADHPTTAATAAYVGDALSMRGEHRAAIEAYERARAATLATWGATHPDLAAIEANIGLSLADLGELQGARTHLQAALELRRRIHPPGDLQIHVAEANLAQVVGELGMIEDALAMMVPAVDGIRAALGPDHFAVGGWRSNVGNLYRRMDRLAQAESETAEALRIFEAAVGPRHPDVAAIRSNLGQILLEQGRFAEAEPILARAVEEMGAAVGPDNPRTAKLSIAWADALVRTGEPGRGQLLLEAAIAVLQTPGSDPGEVRAAQVVLAHAQWTLGQRDEALALAERLQAELPPEGIREQHNLAHLDALLEQWRAELDRGPRGRRRRPSP